MISDQIYGRITINISVSGGRKKKKKSFDTKFEEQNKQNWAGGPKEKPAHRAAIILVSCKVGCTGHSGCLE